AVDVLRRWREILEALPSALRPEFAKIAWDAGAVHLATGFPLAALRTWIQEAEEIRTRDSIRQNELAIASERFGRAEALAKEFQIACPAHPPTFTALALNKTVEVWRTQVLQPFLVNLFWSAHRPGLERRLSHGCALTDTRLRAVTMLLHSARQGV